MPDYNSVLMVSHDNDSYGEEKVLRIMEDCSCPMERSMFRKVMNTGVAVCCGTYMFEPYLDMEVA